MKASSLYPPEKLRDPQWVKTMSHTPTLMDYSRFNYVAQPEDGIDPADLIPKIGPYDKFATMWGYKPITGASTPDGEKATLNEWALLQDDTPWLRFSTAQAGGTDPGNLTEAVGDGDAVASTALGLKNLERVASFLLEATTTEPGEPYDDLEEIYGVLLGQWARELNHVPPLVGGFNSQQKHAGQEGVRFVAVPREKQVEAVRFLNENAFETPSFLIDPEILRRIEPIGVIARIRTAQRRVLSSLLSNARIARLVEQEALDGSGSYRPTDFLADVRHGVWSELDADKGEVRTDAFRRNLQRAYIELMNAKLNGNQAASDDTRPFVRGELADLRRSIDEALPNVSDRETRLHLEDIVDQIGKALDPRLILNDSEALSFLELDPDAVDLMNDLNCWTDYSIRLGDR